jgi:REP element-mobilizing transposase RayT
MGRPWRNLTTSRHVHLINRGVDGQDLFSISADRLVFETILADVCGKYGIGIAAYALMSNHYHLLGDLSSCPDPVQASQAMCELQSGYARHFNRRTSRHGPLFEPRFLGYPVTGEAGFTRVTRYIHANPIDITGRRALGAYRWSSLPVYLGRREAPRWMNTEPLASAIDPRTYLAQLVDISTEDLRPVHDLPPRVAVTPAVLEDALADTLRRTSGRMDERRRRRFLIMLCLDLRSADVVELSDRYGCSPTHIRREAHRARTELVDDPTFASLSDAVRRRAARLATNRSLS